MSDRTPIWKKRPIARRGFIWALMGALAIGAVRLVMGVPITVNLDVALQIVSISLTVGLAGIGVEMANHPPTSRTERLIYRSVFIVVGTLLVVTTYWQGERNIGEQNRLKASAELQERRLDDRYGDIKSQYDKLEGKLGTIEKFAKHPPSGLSPQQVNETIRVMAGSENLRFVSDVSNNDLRQETAAYTKALREMEAKRSQAWSMTLKPLSWQSGAEERRAYANAVCERVENDFRQNYQEKGVNLQRALVERLKITGPLGPTILDDAPFYLPDLGHPLDELADYLDGLAKRLPYP